MQGSLVNGSLGLVKDFCSTKDALSRGAFLGISDRSGTASASPKAILSGYKEYELFMREHKGSNYFDKQRKQTPDRWQISQEVVDAVLSPKVWPVVQFGKLEVVCIRAHFEATTARGNIEAIRNQIPLILAWALSIHKSQGQTLERVRVNMGRIFEKGQGEMHSGSDTCCLNY